MSSRQDALYLAAAGWIEDRTLRTNNLLHFIRSLMLDAAANYPDVPGSEKKALVLGVIEDVLEDPDLDAFVRGKDTIKRAAEKLVPSWIDVGIRVHKQPDNLFSNPDSSADTNTTPDVIARIADVAEQWFKNKVVTASNVIVGITAIMSAAGKFFRGNGEEKRELVLSVVKEIVSREATQIKPGDRDAIFLAIDTFGAPIVDFLVDLSTGQFDFKGFIQGVRDMCLPLSSCCQPKPAAAPGGGGGIKDPSPDPPL